MGNSQSSCSIFSTCDRVSEKNNIITLLRSTEGKNYDKSARTRLVIIFSNKWSVLRNDNATLVRLPELTVQNVC